MGYHLTTLQPTRTISSGKPDHANQIFTIHKHVLRRLRQLVLIFMATTKREQEQEQVCNLLVAAVKDFGEKGIDSALSTWALESSQATKGSLKIGDADVFYAFRVTRMDVELVEIEESLIAAPNAASVAPRFFETMAYCMGDRVSENPHFDYLKYIVK